MKNDSLRLLYKQPAVKWTEALPLGNGRMGAMVYGGDVSERIELTECTCWSGEASGDNSQKDACKAIPEIREALFRHDYTEANQLAEKIIGSKLNFGTNLPFGNLKLNFNYQYGTISHYSRGLWLDNAVSFVKYKADDVYYERETFISNTHQVIVMRAAGSSPGKLDLTVSLDGYENPFTVEADENKDLVLTGHAFESIHSDGKTGVAIYGRLRLIIKNGTVTVTGDSLHVKTADSAVLLLSLGTDFDNSDPAGFCRKCIDEAAAIGYDELLAAHIKDHQRLFNRVDLKLGNTTTEHMATDERLAAVKNGEEDPSLTALMFQYGRYLLMSSSREDSPLPAHLQGIWNDNIACRIGWTNDMHLDMNTEMNYWPVEVTNLSECGKPLYNWIEQRLVPSGKQTARATYGIDGWVAHVVSNAWGYSAPGWATSWGIFPTGGLWVASQMWEHYLFTGDDDFLRDHLYPIYREAVRFFLKYLTKDPASGYYLSGPSMSPENSFVYDWNTSKECSISMGTVCETIMVRELFTSFISSCKALNIEDELLEYVHEMLEKLPPFKIGSRGQLQEWFYDFDEPDPHHRHTSHLLSVFPFAQITPDTTPELAKAAMVSIRKRTTPDWRWEDTGWARALMVLHTARLHEAEEAYRHILAFQRSLTNNNLLSFCPPGAGSVTDVFEMDGTTGLCTGIAEMLLQSHNSIIQLLPALPRQWDSGFVKGLRARGGFEVDITWDRGKLVSAEIFSESGGDCRIRYKGRERKLSTKKGGRCILDFISYINDTAQL